MDEIRIKKLEIDVHNLNRRVTDHDALHIKSRKDIDMLQDIAKSNKDILEVLHKLAEYAEKTYDVFEPLARYGTKIVKIGAIFVAAWHVVKLIYAKFMLLS